MMRSVTSPTRALSWVVMHRLLDRPHGRQPRSSAKLRKKKGGQRRGNGSVRIFGSGGERTNKVSSKRTGVRQRGRRRPSGLQPSSLAGEIHLHFCSHVF